MQPILEIKNISKKFRIHHERAPYLSLRDNIVNLFKSPFTSVVDGLEDFWALQAISFDVYPGESIGIIGKNGAGKSTLLKILSKITPPTKGKIIVRGRVASLLEVGTGFHPELTGRENVFLNASILGMKRKEILRKFDEIIDFSGVEKFLDTPLKHYSSGMQLRLAFAVAAFLEPEVLLIDEVLAVGDVEFQNKCLGKMEDITKKEGRTVLFVSHNMTAVKQLCFKGILLQNGRLINDGKIEEVIGKYLGLTRNSNFYQPKITNPHLDISFRRIEITNNNNINCSEFRREEKIKINFQLQINRKNQKYSLFVIIKNKYGVPVFSAQTPIEKEKYTLVIQEHFLTRGSYSIHTFIHIPQIIQIDVAQDICQFTIIDTSSDFTIHGDYDYGVVFGRFIWE